MKFMVLGEPVITIKELDNFIWEYLNYIGEGKYKRCEECNVNLVKITKNSNKYCSFCRVKKELEKKRRWWKNKTRLSKNNQNH